MTEEPATYTTRTPLLTAVIILANARDDALKAASLLTEKRAQFQLENTEIIAEAQAAAERVANAEKVVRVIAEEDYDGHDRHPAPGVAIRMEKVLPEYRPDQALAWCKEHQIGLIYDKKVFESTARAGGVDFLQLWEQPRATIATDLENALKEAGVAWRASENYGVTQ